MNGSLALPRTPTRRAPGTISGISSRLLAASSAAAPDNPVTLPSGRASLLISPVAIGSPAIMTMGLCSRCRELRFHPWPAGPCDARHFIGQRDRDDLERTSRQELCEPWVFSYGFGGTN